MNLYLVVWQFSAPEMECEWTHIVSSKPYLSTSDEEAIIIKFMKENYEYSRSETLGILDNYWSNKIDIVDGHKISVERVV